MAPASILPTRRKVFPSTRIADANNAEGAVTAQQQHARLSHFFALTAPTAGVSAMQRDAPLAWWKVNSFIVSRRPFNALNRSMRTDSP